MSQARTLKITFYFIQLFYYKIKMIISDTCLKNHIKMVIN